MSEAQVWLRLVAAILLGGVVGLERELSGQRAGLRTHALLALGAALFTLIGLELFLPPLAPPRSQGDAGRIVAALATGVGFLGAGAIVRARGTVTGLTTAASLWATAAVGLAVGVGMYETALIAVALILVVLRGFEWLKERMGLTKRRRKT